MYKDPIRIFHYCSCLFEIELANWRTSKKINVSNGLQINQNSKWGRILHKKPSQLLQFSFLEVAIFSFSEGKSFVFINCGGICALSVCNLWETTRTDNLVLRKKRHIATMNILTVKNCKNEFEPHCNSVLDFFRSVDNIFLHLPKGCRGSVNNKAWEDNAR